MKYIITESKLEKTAIHYLNEMYGDLKENRTDKWPDSTFFIKDKKVYMERDLINNDLWVDYYSIWDDLETVFSFENSKIKDIITKWVDETYNIKGVKPDVSWHHPLNWWRKFII